MKHALKLELHCHLDTSVRVKTVAELGRALGLRQPDPLEPALVAPESCTGLADYLMRVPPALEVMQHRDHLVRIARELVKDFHADGVIYGEVRFAPQLHLREGLTLSEVLDAVDEGLRQGRTATGVRTGLILCCLRHEPPELSVGIARLAIANRERVCGIDLAGDEERYPGAPHRAAFELAREAGLHRTVHAGEAAGAESIREALDVLGAERIGHGARIAASPELVERVRREGIALEMCPRSNCQTRAVTSMAEHPIDRLLRQQVRVTVSTDARTISATTVTREFERLREQFGWGETEFNQCQLHAATAAFASAAVRDELLRALGVVRNGA